MTRQKAIKKDLNKEFTDWKKRRAVLRKRLWDLLTAGYIKPKEGLNVKVIAEGTEAIEKIQEKRDMFLKTFPWQKEAHPNFLYEWNGPVSWDTYVISYDGWEGEPPQHAVLRVPKNLTKPAPAMICPHGHNVGCYIGKETVDYFAIPLTAKGFVTISPDALRFGERRNTDWEKSEIEDYKGYSFYSERNLAMPLINKGQTLLGAMIWESMRTVDVLQGMDEIDSKRIGTIGMSMGGVLSLWLAAMDSRISCGVEVCGAVSYEEITNKQMLQALVLFVPHILRYTDIGEIAGLIAPRPFLFINATNDLAFPLESFKKAIEQTRGIYSLYGAKDNVEDRIFSGGHYFQESEIEYALDWLSKKMNP